MRGGKRLLGLIQGIFTPFFFPPARLLLSNFPPHALFDLQLRTTMSTSERFDCHYCKDSLLGKKYIMKEDTQYCTKCYENLFANCCEGCSSPIGCNSKVRKTQCYPGYDIRNV